MLLFIILRKKNKKFNFSDRNPEWLMDNDEENAMTFDESGKFVSVKVKQF